MTGARIIALVIGYVFGLFETGYFIGKMQKVDIRTVGSGNIGTTNTLRTLGVKAGLLTFIGDCGKTILAMLIAWLIFHNRYPDGAQLLKLYAGVGAVLGHNFPVTMKFKGGKGVACTSALILVFAPLEAPVCLIVFILSVALTRYVSVGSLLVMAAFVIQTILFTRMGWVQLGAVAYLPEIYLVVVMLALLCVVQHRKNIVRLIHGEENKLSFGKNKEV
ncbi:MAG: glycerol-3-phosphate 1-O-acyltransferase PlsY [Lachnospiraceae bacterium]